MTNAVNNDKYNFIEMFICVYIYYIVELNVNTDHSSDMPFRQGIDIKSIPSLFSIFDK